MKLYQKLKEIIMSSDMTVVDKAYACTALDDMAAYVTSDDYARFVDGGMSGFNGLGLNDKQGALNFLSAAGGLAEYDCYSGGSIHHLDTTFVNENADVLVKCFEKNGLITGSIVDEAVDSLCSLYTEPYIMTSVDDAGLSHIKMSLDDAESFAKQEIVWRFSKKELKKVSDVEESKLLDTNADLFLKMFSDDSRITAFVVSLFRSMSDAQLRDVYAYL